MAHIVSVLMNLDRVIAFSSFGLFRFLLTSRIGISSRIAISILPTIISYKPSVCNFEIIRGYDRKNNDIVFL